MLWHLLQENINYHLPAIFSSNPEKAQECMKEEYALHAVGN